MESQGEMEFLKGKFGGNRFWTGASDVVTEGTWQWTDGSPVSWTYWGWSNPDGGASENCALWHNSLQGWVDAPCYYSRYSVCSMKVSQDLALRIETIFLISTDCVLCRIVTGNPSPTPAVPPRSRADCGEETATLTATVSVILSVAQITVTKCSRQPPPPRTAVWPSVRAGPAKAAAALRVSPATNISETVTETTTVLAVSPVAPTTVWISGDQWPTIYMIAANKLEIC